MPPEKITDDMSFEDTPEWDSLKHMELIATLEDELNIELTMDDIVTLTTVAKLREFVENYYSRNKIEN
jgi:acyl carrier protein